MNRTTVKLPRDLDALLRHEAARRGTTMSELAREAIAAHLGVGERRRLLAAGAGRSGRSDISERIEEILRQAAAERLQMRQIATLDRRHTTFVRPTGIPPLQLLP